MNYQKHYDRLIFKATNRILIGYKEKHHIIPKCMGGLDKPDNLVELTPEEHFVAHQLLVKIFPDNLKIITAAINMCSGNQQQKRNNKLYGWLRRNYSNNRKGRTKENDPSVKAMSEKLKGRTKETHEYLRRHSEKLKGRTKENDPSVKAMSEKLKGRTKENDPSVKAMSEKLKGRTKETHDGIHRQSELIKGRTKENDPSVKAMSEKLKGRTKETHDGIHRQSELIKGRCILKECHRLILVDKRDSGETFPRIVNYFKSISIDVKTDYLRKIYFKMKENHYFKDDSKSIRPSQCLTDQNILTLN